MKVSLDGGLTWNEAPEGVRVDVQEDENEGVSLILNCTQEGLIIDRYSAGEGGGDFQATACMMWADVAGMTR